jgi:hypothetical protein
MKTVQWLIVLGWTLLFIPVNLFFLGKIKLVMKPVPHLVIRRKSGKWSWSHGLIINLSPGADKYVYYHELVHLEQFIDSYGTMPFFYAYQYIKNLIRYRNFKKAYLEVQYEIEARAKEEEKRIKDSSLNPQGK